MMAVIMDGKVLAKRYNAETAEIVKSIKRDVGLVVVLVGDDPASQRYVANKEKDCAACGIKSVTARYPATITELQLCTEIINLMHLYPEYGIMVQMPLPEHIHPEHLLDLIPSTKDVDGLTSVSIGSLCKNRDGLLPCTPAGIMALLYEYGIDPVGKSCCVIGRSNIVGKPMAMLLTNANATVTLTHSHTKNLTDAVSRADIVVSASGHVGLLKPDMVKPGAVVIDVTTAMTENGWAGDVADFDKMCEKVSFITPVPGGVGPMTRAMLMRNVVLANEMREELWTSE